MAQPQRSPVPDLLFEDQQEARALELGPLVDAPEGLTEAAPLHRVTVFLTYRCNLACPYCKTIARTSEELAARPQKANSYDVDAFEQLLAAHDGTPIRHLHFTGGEAGIVPGLATMIAAAKSRGVASVSLTSNGTLPAGSYLELVAAGLDELRISIDADDAALGATLTGRAHAFERVVRTLEGLAQARRSGTRFFLIFNSVIGVQNRARLPQLLRFLLRFGPDDFKLITEVDARDRLGAFPGAREVRREVEALLREHPGSFPLLRRKLDTVFARDAIGLDPRLALRTPRWRCYIPLTERTVDRDFYYPCSVYLREGGTPLGPLTDSPEQQRSTSAAFVRDSDCASDPICQRYCLHCTRAYNERVNAGRTSLEQPAAGELG